MRLDLNGLNQTLNASNLIIPTLLHAKSVSAMAPVSGNENLNSQSNMLHLSNQNNNYSNSLNHLNQQQHHQQQLQQQQQSTSVIVNTNNNTNTNNNNNSKKLNQHPPSQSNGFNSVAVAAAAELVNSLLKADQNLPIQILNHDMNHSLFTQLSHHQQQQQHSTNDNHNNNIGNNNSNNNNNNNSSQCSINNTNSDNNNAINYNNNNQSIQKQSSLEQHHQIEDEKDAKSKHLDFINSIIQITNTMSQSGLGHFKIKSVRIVNHVTL